MTLGMIRGVLIIQSFMNNIASVSTQLEVYYTGFWLSQEGLQFYYTNQTLTLRF
jgi:hypothetical protein